MLSGTTRGRTADVAEYPKVKESNMQRRHLLKAITSAATGAGLGAAAGQGAWAKGTIKRASTANPIPFPFIETRDGTNLFHKDWGAGRPVLFVHGWALNSDMWQYQ